MKDDIKKVFDGMCEDINNLDGDYLSKFQILVIAKMIFELYIETDERSIILSESLLQLFDIVERNTDRIKELSDKKHG